ncbi:MAG: HU family DNA-binding protein [Pirellulales bacterium]
MTTKTKTKTAKGLSKSELYAALAETSGLSKSQVNDLFESLVTLIGKSVGSGGPGVFTFPGLLKIKVVRKPATPARTGVNPFTKQETVFKAKPARNVVKLQALKPLKALV